MTLDQRVLAAIGNGYQVFSEIDGNARKLSDGSFRATEGALRRLRKQGIIRFEKGLWKLVIV